MHRSLRSGLLPGDTGANWPADKVPLQPPSTQERLELAKLSPAALQQIPNRWHALFSEEMPAAALPATAIAPE